LSAAEVERAKTILLSDVAINNESNTGLAGTLGYYAKVAGDYNFGLTYPDGVRAVTVDDVVALARKYIDPQKYLEMVLVPKDAAPAVAPATTGIITATLDNGLQIILQPDPNTDVVAFHTMAGGGRSVESGAQAGLTNLTQQMLQRGTASRSEEELFSALEDVGAKVGSTVLPDAGDVSLVATRDTWQKALPLYLDVLLAPGFRQADFDQLKDNTLKAITARQDDLLTVTANNLRQAFFGPGGYGNADLGTAETVGALTLDDVKNFYGQYYVPNNMVVSVAGNFDPQVMLARLRSRLAGIPAGVAVERTPPTVSITQDKLVTTTRESGVSYLLVAFPGAAVSNKDYAAMKLLGTIAGGGMSSRLFVELRDKQGLAYSTAVSFGPRAGDTVFMPYIIALPENADKGIDGILAILADIRDNGVTDEELDRAKNKELGTFLLNHETADSRAMNLAGNTMMGLGIDYDQHYPDQIRAVTKADIQRVAQDYLNHHVIARLDPSQP